MSFIEKENLYWIYDEPKEIFTGPSESFFFLFYRN